MFIASMLITVAVAAGMEFVAWAEHRYINISTRKEVKVWLHAIMSRS